MPRSISGAGCVRPPHDRDPLSGIPGARRVPVKEYSSEQQPHSHACPDSIDSGPHFHACSGYRHDHVAKAGSAAGHAKADKAPASDAVPATPPKRAFLDTLNTHPALKAVQAATGVMMVALVPFIGYELCETMIKPLKPIPKMPALVNRSTIA